MMPIFFNLESHLWVFYLYFVNGLLLSFIFAVFSSRYSELTQLFEAKVVAGFIISIGLNGALLIGAVLLGINWESIGYILPVITALFLACLLYARSSIGVVPFRWLSVGRCLLYPVVFFIMFFNGGLIEQVSDAWWHMSLAKKMGLESAFDLSKDHLNGVNGRYYPPLWHANLALANRLSGESLPIIWNTATAWVSVIKVMAFFLFSLALTGSRKVAFIAAVLFFLLPGIGPSLQRVSAWPSHVAYVLLFASYYIVFAVLRDDKEIIRLSNLNYISRVISVLSAYKVNFSATLYLSILIFYTHQLELLWLFISLFVYMMFLCESVSRHSGATLMWAQFLRPMYLFLLLVLLAICSVFYWQESNSRLLSVDLELAYLMPILLLALLVLKNVVVNERLKQGISIAIVATLVLSINFRHLLSLVIPELSFERSGSFERPLAVPGLFGGQLILPGWHLQLREGLMFSGLLSFPLAVLLVVVKPSRAAYFLLGNTIVVFSIISSPYLYQWLQDLLSYHSTWRVAVLVFAPIVLAIYLVENARLMLLANRSIRRSIASFCALISVVALVGYQSWPHFDRAAIMLKQQYKSAQRNWSLYYGQQYVYQSSAIKYSKDFAQLAKVVEPNSLLLSDISTSYYASAMLPVYVRNVHQHQGRSDFPAWSEILRQRHWCYLDVADRRDEVVKFVDEQSALADGESVPRFRYIMINKDQVNVNMKNDCLSQRRTAMIKNIEGIASPIFDGEYLMLYEVNKI